MELPLAKEHAKNKVLSRDFFNKVVEKIITCKTGRVTVMCGMHSVSKPNKDLAIKLLKEKGYEVNIGYNTYSVPYLIVEW